MAQPIYKVFMFKNTEAYFQATKEELDAKFEKLGAAFEKVGGKRIATCDATWSTDQWQIFGIEVFPSLEAVQEYTQVMNEINLGRYVESVSFLGTEMP